MTKTIKETWREEFKETRFAKSGGGCWECCDYEEIYADTESFIESLISQVEALVRRETVEEILHGFPNKEFYNKIGNELNEGRHLAYDDTKEYIKHYAKTNNITL